MNTAMLHLACGHPVTPLLDTVADEAGSGVIRDDPSCPVCAQELARLRTQWKKTIRTAAEPVPIPAGLTQRMLDSIRGMRGRTFGEPLRLSDERGVTSVSERALLLITRKLAAEFAAENGGLHVRGISAEDDGVHLTVETRYRTNIVAITDGLRSWLRTELAQHAGDAVPAIHLHVATVSG